MRQIIRISVVVESVTTKALKKVLDRARLRKVAYVEPEVLEQLGEGGLEADRVLEFEVIAMDWNCLN